MSGSAAQVTCLATEGDLPMDVQWHFRGSNVSSAGLGMTTTKVGSRTNLLVIDSVTPQNGGLYTCRASNAAGIAEYSAELLVQGISYPAHLRESRPISFRSGPWEGEAPSRKLSLSEAVKIWEAVIIVTFYRKAGAAATLLASRISRPGELRPIDLHRHGRRHSHRFSLVIRRPVDEFCSGFGSHDHPCLTPDQSVDSERRNTSSVRPL